MTDDISNTQQNRRNEPTLVGMTTCLEMIFRDKATRPSIRTFHSWKSKGYLPFLKVGKRIFLDPVQVRKALDKRFTIEAID